MLVRNDESLSLDDAALDRAKKMFVCQIPATQAAELDENTAHYIQKISAMIADLRPRDFW